MLGSLCTNVKIVGLWIIFTLKFFPIFLKDPNYMVIMNFSFENQTLFRQGLPCLPPPCVLCLQLLSGGLMWTLPALSLQLNRGSLNPPKIHSIVLCVLHFFCLQNFSFSFEILPNNRKVASMMNDFS